MSNFIGFDCATKTLAFNICKVDLENIENIDDDVVELNEILKSLTKDNEDEIFVKVNEINERTKHYIEIIDADVVDLDPSRADGLITTVERIKLLHRYITERVFPVIPDGDLTVIIEDQTINKKSGVIEHALAALFMGRAQQIEIVDPNIRKTVCFDLINGRYSCFVPKYTTSTGAIKAHSKYNFGLTEQHFYSTIPFIPKKDRVHLADSFWQIMGWLKYSQLPLEEQTYSKHCKAKPKKKKMTKKTKQMSLKQQIAPKKFIPQIYDD